MAHPSQDNKQAIDVEIKAIVSHFSESSSGANGSSGTGTAAGIAIAILTTLIVLAIAALALVVLHFQKKINLRRVRK